MRRELIALFPMVALSGAFMVNQSCATKSALEEVGKELDEPKKNLEVAKENLKVSRTNINDARSILERAKEKIAQKSQMQKVIAPTKEETEQPKETAEMGSVKVGWCDTLWDISAKVYDNALYWPAIYDLNKDKVGDDPWMLVQGTVLKYKVQLSEEEKDRAVKTAIEWDLKYKDRPKSPKCPPK